MHQNAPDSAIDASDEVQEREGLFTGLETQKKSQWRDVHWLLRLCESMCLVRDTFSVAINSLLAT